MTLGRLHKKRYKLPLWGLLLLGLTAGIVTWAGASDRCLNFMARHILYKVNGSIPGTLSLGEVRGSLWSRLRIEGLELRHHDQLLFRLSSVDIRYAISGMLSGEIRVDKMAGTGLELNLTRNVGSEFEILEALGLRPSTEASVPETSAPLKLPGWPIVHLSSFTLENSRIVWPEFLPGKDAEVRMISLDLELTAKKRLNLQLKNLELKFLLSGYPETSLVTRAGIDSDFSDLLLESPQLVLQSSLAQLHIQDIGLDSRREFLKFRGQLEQRDPAALQALFEKWPFRNHLLVEFSGRGKPGHPVVQLLARHEHALLEAEVSLDLRPTAPLLIADLNLRHFDLEDLVLPASIKGRLDTTLSLSGNIDAWRDMEAKGKCSFASLSGYQVQLSEGDITWSLKHQKFQVDTSFRLEQSRHRLQGDFSLSDGEHTFELTSSDLDLSYLPLDIPPTKSSLNIRARVHGRGLNLETLGSTLDITLGASTFGGKTIEGGKVSAVYGDNTLTVSRLDLKSGSCSVSGELQLSTAMPWQHRSSLSLDFQELQPWMAPLSTDLRGKLKGNLRASGNIHTSSLSFQVSGNHLTHLNFSAAELTTTGSFDILAFTTPVGVLEIQAQGLQGLSGLETLKASVNLENRASFMSARLHLDASAEGQQHLQLSGSHQFDATHHNSTVDSLNLKLPYDQWKLEAPVHLDFDVATRNFDISRMVLVGNTSRLELSGNLHPDGSNDLAFNLRNFNLSTLNPYLPKDSATLSGNLLVEAHLLGTFESPALQGQVVITGGTAHVIPLGLKYQNIEFKSHFSDNQISQLQLDADCRGGHLSLSGTVSNIFKDVPDSSLDLSLKNWPMVDSPQADGQVSGNLQTRSSSNLYHVAGHLTLERFTLRPDLDVLDESSTSLDPTIDIVEDASKAPKPTPLTTFSWFDRLQPLSVNILVSAPNNLWVRHANAVNEWGGEMRLEKKVSQELSLAGSIACKRGWIALKGHRFNIDRSKLAFAGAYNDPPLLDISSSVRISNYKVICLIQGPSDQPQISLSSEPPLEQADIVSLLLFGRTTKSLNADQESSVEHSARNMAVSYAASAAFDSVKDQLIPTPLDIDLETVDTEGARIGVGHYLNHKTYFHVEQGFGRHEGQKFSLEYLLTPLWKIVFGKEALGSSSADLIWDKHY